VALKKARASARIHGMATDIGWSRKHFTASRRQRNRLGANTWREPAQLAAELADHRMTGC
jgi:hypothetical protein